MKVPARHRQLEARLIDVLRSTSLAAAERRQAWQVYADWLLENLDEPLPLRILLLGSGRDFLAVSRAMWARTPNLERLRLRAYEGRGEPDLDNFEAWLDSPSRAERLLAWLGSDLPALRDLELSVVHDGDWFVEALARTAGGFGGRLRRLRVDFVRERDRELLEIAEREFPALERCLLGMFQGPPEARARLDRAARAQLVADSPFDPD